jgi:hypothetical protein
MQSKEEGEMRTGIIFGEIGPQKDGETGEKKREEDQP